MPSLSALLLGPLSGSQTLGLGLGKEDPEALRKRQQMLADIEQQIAEERRRDPLRYDVNASAKTTVAPKVGDVPEERLRLESPEGVSVSRATSLSGQNQQSSIDLGIPPTDYGTRPLPPSQLGTPSLTLDQVMMALRMLEELRIRSSLFGTGSR